MDCLGLNTAILAEKIYKNLTFGTRQEANWTVEVPKHEVSSYIMLFSPKSSLKNQSILLFSVQSLGFVPTRPEGNCVQPYAYL